jgi:hypothetical protein
VKLPILARARIEDRPRFYLQERDKAIVRAVYQHRALTRAQIERLFWGQPGPEPNTRCQLRLQRLYQHGYLDRDDQPQKITEGRKPLVYFLDEAGAALLAELDDVGREQIDWHKRENDVSWLFLNHLLRVNDVRLSLTLSAHEHNWTIRPWLDDQALRRDKRDYVPVQIEGKDGRRRVEKVAFVPDGYAVLDAAGEEPFHYFLEIDLGTVTGRSAREGRRDWSRKVKAYLGYRVLGLFKTKYGGERFRVLTVTTSEARLRNLIQATEQAKGTFSFAFTTFDRFQGADPLTDQIWSFPGRQERAALIER